MNNTLGRMSMQLLRKDIEDAVNNLLPRFRVTEEERIKFKKPKIRRILKSSEYPEHDREITCYVFLENFLYFPLSFPLDYHSPSATIHHEASHYIHNQINADIAKKFYLERKTGKTPKGIYKLTEVVAEYGNFILGLNDEERNWYIRHCDVTEDSMEIYGKYGPEFLPHLARMSLDDVIKEKIVKV